MKRLARILGVAGMFGAALTLSVASTPAIAMEGKAVIEKRITLMKTGVLKNYLYAKKFVKDGEGTAEGVVKHAKLLSEASKEVVALFPKGTGRGDFDDKTTRALPKIWEDWAGFKAVADTMVQESAKLAEVAAGGDKDAIGAQFGKMAKASCGGCHKPFRGAKVK